jgi:hypothetical protein
VRSGAGVRRAVRAVPRYLRRAPGSYGWLTVLLATTVVRRGMSPAAADALLRRQSTNLHQLGSSPVRVLISSAMWLAEGGWLAYFVVYHVFQVPVERWLGTVRWLLVMLVAHVGATLASQGWLWWAIRRGRAPVTARYTLDYGVSYAVAGAQGVLCYAVREPWRYAYLAGLLVVFGRPLRRDPSFTDVGHASAMLLGLACCPIARAASVDRIGGPIDPVASVQALLRRVRERVTTTATTTTATGDAGAISRA